MSYSSTQAGRAYKQVATRTAAPGQLVLMLFDGAIRFLDRALTGFILDDPAEFNATIHNNIQRAQAIIQELSASLNLELGGKLASTLRDLYDFIDRQLTRSNLRKERHGIEDSLGRLGVLREAWATMLAGVGATESNRLPALAAA